MTTKFDEMREVIAKVTEIMDENDIVELEYGDLKVRLREYETVEEEQIPGDVVYPVRDHTEEEVEETPQPEVELEYDNTYDDPDLYPDGKDPLADAPWRKKDK